MVSGLMEFARSQTLVEVYMRRIALAGIGCEVVASTVRSADVETTAGEDDSCTAKLPVNIVTIWLFIAVIVLRSGRAARPTKADVWPANCGLLTPCTTNSNTVS